MDYLIIDKPTTVDNLSFMFEYQFGYMYWRYLMWNFVGRQNDREEDSQDGKLDSGIKFMDELHLVLQDNYQKMCYKIRDATYYFLPFLGLIGLMYHANKDRKVLCAYDFILIHLR
jgi:hypothetical protein